MVYISKVCDSPTVDFAAEELKKYLRMMCPSLDVAISKGDKGGYRLGLMQDFGLDVSDAKDCLLDDILYADVSCDEGIIAGDNPRAVLLAVYELLRENGCRWLFPGVDGEFIPNGRIEKTSFRKKASCRFRGPCLEGACNQEALIATIDFLPKAGMNMFQCQFLLPIFFYRRFYLHWSSAVRDPETMDENTVLRWIAMAECEMQKRGIQYHAVGHGWTAAPFGIDVSTAWAAIDESTVTADQLQYMAMLDGERRLYGGVPTNTQFCMSNPKARSIVANYIADYAKEHTYIDFMDVWLADGHNNHCTCPECEKKTPSDWYVMLLNDIDDALNARGLDTKVIFCAYTDTTWAPVIERVNNPDRFALLLAPISRSYTKTLSPEDKPTMPPYEKNNIVMPEDLATYLGYFEDWKKVWPGMNICFEYYFWLHQYYDQSTLTLAKRIYEDIECYSSVGIDGLIGCGSERSFFPNGLCYHVFARKMFDSSLSFEELVEDYFSTAYGNRWREVADYLTRLGDAFGQAYLEGEESIDYAVSKHYNPERAIKLATVKDIVKDAQDLLDESLRHSERVVVNSYRMLREHAAYCKMLAEVFILKANGDNEGAIAEFEVMREKLSEREVYLEKVFDFTLCMEGIRRIIKGKQRDDAFGG